MQIGVVAAGHEVTADAAREILEDGGNAFDAALAGLLASCVPEVVLSSIGGGGFMMAHLAESGETRLYDFFAETPRRQRATQDIEFYPIEADFGPATQIFHIGAGSSATPGIVPGLFAIHDDLCRLPMSRIAEPAARVARAGVAMTEFQAYLFTIIEPILTATPNAAKYFAPGGRLLAGDDIYRVPEFADTLEALAQEGSRLFTEGEIAQAIVAQAREHGGHLTLDDLSSYRVERRAPLAWTHRGTRIAFNPPPSAGGTLIAFGLGLIEQLRATPGGPSALAMANVMTQTNLARAEEDLSTMIHDGVLTKHFRALQTHWQSRRGTTHISVIDRNGNAAAITVSNGEGNGRMVGSCGFMLNNMLGEEDLNPEGFHAWPTGSRLSSMMAPTIIRHSDGGMTALGSGGSNRIRTAILQVTVNLIERGFSLEKAVSAARLHIERGGKLSYEDGPWTASFPADERDALRSAFDDCDAWPEANLFFGGVHAVHRSTEGRIVGAGDPRRCGVVATAKSDAS